MKLEQLKLWFESLKLELQGMHQHLLWLLKYCLGETCQVMQAAALQLKMMKTNSTAFTLFNIGAVLV